ncbi:hypothetical protein MTP04_08670 [Lysinibacillus sp. PLM2]|nr:hypothetical protein MTP04_08670 [Lysinibacillus sp. PLM2]
MHLSVENFVEGTKLILKLKGVLDYSTVDTFNFKEFTSDSIEEIEVDFSNLEFIDSTGIGAIISILHTAVSLSAKVNFKGMSEDTKELFETIGIFDIKKSLLGDDYHV